MYKILGGDGKEYGPIAAEVVRLWIKEGRANAQTLVQPEGGSGWVPIGQVPEFGSSFSAPPTFSSVVINPTPANHPFALTGFILSLVSVTFGLCCCYGFPFSVSGIIFSIIGLVQIRKQPERFTGRGLAIAGIVIGIVSLVLVAVLMILGVALNWEEIKKDLQSH
jgi:hypothetical protein